MVVLSKIYTRTGDAGQTRLADNSVASKIDPRVEAYGAVDECNAHLGVVLATGTVPPDMAAAISTIQNELFDLGADLATPLRNDPPWPPLRIDQAAIDRLEHWCDEFGDPLPTLRSFILPGGTPAAAAMHVARTVCRRAERRAWQAHQQFGSQIADAGTDPSLGGVNVLAITYLNRLSDLLFIWTRTLNQGDEPLWVPGGQRPADTTEPTTPTEAAEN